MTEPLLAVEGLCVNYGRVAAVRDVSFRAEPGQLITLIGANGAGKSSTLRAIAGMQRARSGTVRFDGEDVTRRKAHQLVGRGLVMVAEGRAILSSLTIDENLRLGGWHTGSRSGPIINEMYERFAVLSDRRNLLAGALSGGEQQMLAIARALVAEPKVLLLDEPSMGLAPKIVDAVFDVIADIRASGTTVVLVEQNARRALRAADYGYVLASGEIAREGPAQTLLADESIVADYLGM